MKNLLNRHITRIASLVLLISTILLATIPIETVASSSSAPLFEITLVAPGTANQARRQWAQIVRNALQQVGIDAKVAYLGWGAVFDRILFAPEENWGKSYAEGGWDALFIGYGWTMPIPIPNLKPQYYGSEAYFPPGGNYFLYNDTKVNELTEKYIRTLNVTERTTTIKELQAYLQMNGPDFIIFYDKTVSVTTPALQNYDPLIFPAPQRYKGLTAATIAVPGEPTAFNIILSNSWYDMPFLGAINERGVDMNYAKEFVKSLFTSWSSSTDGKEWTINLRQGVKWHDDVEVTTDDFIYWVWLQLEPGRYNAAGQMVGLPTGGQETGYWTDVLGNDVTLKWVNGTSTTMLMANFTKAGTTAKKGSVTAVDKYTLSVKLPETYGIFDPDTVVTWRPAPKHVLEAIPVSQWSSHSFNTGEGTYTITRPDGTTTTWTGPVGTGPYKFVSYDRTKQLVTTEKFAGYWNKTALEAEGKYTISTWKTVFITDKEAALAALKNKEVEILDYNYHFEKDVARLEPAWSKYYIFDAYGLQELGLNMRSPIWGTGTATPLGKKDPSRAAEAAGYVRKAINHLIPRQLIIDNLMDGLPKPGISFVLPAQVGFDTTLKPVEYSIQKAREYLALAGYEVGVNPVTEYNPSAMVGILANSSIVTLQGRIINASSGLPYKYYTYQNVTTYPEGYTLVPVEQKVYLKLEIQESTDKVTWKKIGETWSDSDGNYVASITPRKAGTIYYRVYFPGNTVPIGLWKGYGIPEEVGSVIAPLVTSPTEVVVGSLSAQFTALSSKIDALTAQVSTLTTGLYAAIALIVIVGAAAIYFARRRPPEEA